MNKGFNILLFLVLVLTFVIWSNSFIAIGLLRPHFSAVKLLVLRFGPVGLISLVMVLVFFRQEFVHLVKTHPIRLAAMAFLQVPSYNFFLNYAQAYVNPSAASLIITLNPLFTLVLAVKFLGEPLTVKRAVGTALAFAGLVVVILLGQVGLTASVMIPLNKFHFALLLIMSPLSWAIYTIIAKPLTPIYSTAALNYSTLMVGSLPLLCLVDRDLIRKAASLGGVEIFAWIFLSIFCTIIAFQMWLFGVKHWRASNVSLFVFMNPPLTAFFAYLFFARFISGWFFVGGLVMLVGILLALTGDKRAKTGPQPTVPDPASRL